MPLYRVTTRTAGGDVYLTLTADSPDAATARAAELGEVVVAVEAMPDAPRAVVQDRQRPGFEDEVASGILMATSKIVKVVVVLVLVVLCLGFCAYRLATMPTTEELTRPSNWRP